MTNQNLHSATGKPRHRQATPQVHNATGTQRHLFKLLSLFLLIVSLVSCEDNSVLNTNAKKVEDNKTTFDASGKIYAISINDGVPSQSRNNILVFPDWETFRATSERLWALKERHVNNINKLTAGMTFEEYQEYVESVGFDENQPLIDFEKEHQFYSLRQSIAKAQKEWLSRRVDDENWNEIKKVDPEPVDYFIWSEEQVLLNPQNEVIVKNKMGENIIYKFYPDEKVLLIKNMDEDALQKINIQGLVSRETVAYQHLLKHADSPNFGNEPWTGGGGSSGGGTGGGDDSGNDQGCKKDNGRYTKYFKVGKRRRIKAIQRYRHNTLMYNSKVRATTRYYHKFGFWTPASSVVGAKLHANYPLTCDHSGTKPEDETGANRAHKVDAVWDATDLNYKNPHITDNAVYSSHKRFDYEVTIDFYDHEII